MGFTPPKNQTQRPNLAPGVLPKFPAPKWWHQSCPSILLFLNFPTRKFCPIPARLRLVVPQVLLVPAPPSGLLKAFRSPTASSTDLVFRTPFALANAGTLSVDVRSFRIAGRACTAYGVAVEPCEAAVLAAGERRAMWLTVRPDFSTSLLAVSLTVETASLVPPSPCWGVEQEKTLWHKFWTKSSWVFCVTFSGSIQCFPRIGLYFCFKLFVQKVY